MKHFLSFSLKLIFLFVVLLSSCKQNDSPWENTTLNFITEEYKPFNYKDNGTATGLAPELLKQVCNIMNMECNISFKNWEDGYNEVLTSNNGVLFTTVLNSTRKDLFKWAGPFASLDWNFYCAAGNSLTLNSLDEAKTIGKIGVIAEYAIEEYLKEEGFTNLVYVTDNQDGLTQLLEGKIDLFPADCYTTEAMLEQMSQSIYAVKPVLTIKTDLLYFAFNKQVSDELIADFQQAIDQTKQNGILGQLTRKYLNTSVYPDILQLYTEPYPPLTFRNTDGEITGYGTDIVREIMKRNGEYYDIRLSSWSNGYQLALNNPNFCLFTMDRTAIRENLFQWVGPIGTNTTWLYTRTGSGITVQSIEEAKKLTAIGTVNSWFSTQYLQQQGFTNLVGDDSPEILAEKLIKGEISAFVCSDITFPDILRSIGSDYSTVVPSYSLLSSDFYISFSKTTPVSVVNQWQTTFESMKTDGTLSAIQKRWLP